MICDISRSAGDAIMWCFSYSAIVSQSKSFFTVLLCSGFFICTVFSGDCNSEDSKLVAVELRRTFSAADCATGEVYVNGYLGAVFSTSPEFFSYKLKSSPVNVGSIITKKFNNPIPYIRGENFGLVFKEESGGDRELFYTTSSSSYSNYDRPRKKTRAIPSGTIILGTLLKNRECSISSPIESVYFEHQGKFSSVLNIILPLIFNSDASLGNFKAGMVQSVVVVYSDVSGSFKIEADGFIFNQRRPIKQAVDLAAGDVCLSKLEHMHNAFVGADGKKSILRQDDVWFCTEGVLNSEGLGTNAIEMHQDLRFIALLSHDSCGAILGLPVAWQLIVERDDKGRGGAVWRQCFATEAWEKISNHSDLKYE